MSSSGLQSRGRGRARPRQEHQEQEEERRPGDDYQRQEEDRRRRAESGPLFPPPPLTGSFRGAAVGVPVNEAEGTIYSDVRPAAPRVRGLQQGASTQSGSGSGRSGSESFFPKKNKTKKRNAYMTFVYMRKEEEESYGIKMPQTAPELVNIFAQEWEMMDEDARAPYKAISEASKVERDRWDVD